MLVSRCCENILYCISDDYYCNECGRACEVKPIDMYAYCDRDIFTYIDNQELVE